MKLNVRINTNWKCWSFSTIIFLICVMKVKAAVTTQNVLDVDKPAAVLENEPAAAVVPRYSEKYVLQMCPNMVHHVFEGATPRAKEKAGIFQEYDGGGLMEHENGIDLRDCIAACCEKQQQNQTCNVVFVFKRKCYHVRCSSNEGCLPKENPQTKERVQMVLVNPVQQQQVSESGSAVNIGPEVSWLDVLKAEKSGLELFPSDDTNAAGNPNSLSFWKQSHKYRYPTTIQDPSVYDEDDFPITEKRMKQLLLSSIDDNQNLPSDELSFYGANVPDAGASASKFTTCSVDTLDLENSCPTNEECVPLRIGNTASGICQCIRGFIRNRHHDCVSQDLDYQTGSLRNDLIQAASAQIPATEEQTEKTSETLPPNSLKTEENKKIVVSVVSKEVRLPDKEVTLSAFTVPDEQTSDTKYTYLWSLITQPKGQMNGTISDQSKSKVKLSNLSEGLYTFKVSVSGVNGTYGEAMANVTVLPEARINRVPQVIITPREQIIRQPTSNAVLDGSTSVDDDKITSWHWEVISGPIGYQPKLPDVNTLQLTDLKSPGNYTFKLTVTDSDNVTNSTTANITVLKGTDYPPVANAGDAVILYLPNNNVTLNGTASSDDHDIVAWEWTKDASDETKAVDMQNTRTPYVQLSNLEEGMYTFVLKVTDGSGQSSSAKVHVFVKPQTNSPPVAVAGTNMTINLPRNWVLLNGSQSVDDIKISSFFWRQKSGPNNAVIANANASIANATALTLGLYEFVLIVADENNNTANDSVWVKVVQEKNAAPIANAGGDQSLTLPVSALYLNGSKSWDDLAVVNYTWTRDGTSLAMGHIIGDSDKQQVLIVSNLVHGRYVFKLTVADDQGLTSTDTVSIIVHPDPLLMNLVELTLSMGISVLTQGELDSIVQKIGLLLGDMKVHVRDLKYDAKSEEAILVFYVESTDGNGKSIIVDGLKIEQLLKDKFQRDATILGTVFTDIRTTICQNKCSGHGVCNSITRTCMCEAFWMPSALYFWGIEEANCDWSILYVFVFVIVGFLLLSGLFWGLTFAFRRQKKPHQKRSRPKVQKYSLIGTQDEEAPQFTRKSSLTDSDTDSDVLFETRSKPNGILRSNGVSKNKHAHGQNNYTTTKIGRKIRT